MIQLVAHCCDNSNLFLIEEASNNRSVKTDNLQLRKMNGSIVDTKMKKEKNIRAVLNFDEENEITVTGYRLVHLKWFLTMVAMIGSAGLLWLLLYWIPQWKLWWTHKKVSLEDADTVLIEDEYKKDYKR